MFNEQDHYWMGQALQLAHEAAKQGEVPVGAIIVANNEIIGKAFNQPIANYDPTAHAEILALRTAGEYMQNYRLVDATLYVTLEPCLMCVGAMIHARIKHLVYGATEPKAGAVISRCKTLDQDFLNHRINYRGGLLAEECGAILRAFFRARR